MSKFPEPRYLQVSDDGMITFNDKQWAYLAKMTNTTKLTVSKQRTAIKKLITQAIKAGLKEAKLLDKLSSKKMKLISAVDLISELEGCSKKEAKRLLNQGAVSLAKDENSPLIKIKVDQVFKIETNSH